MADPVEHDLSDGTLAVVALASGFVIDRAGQALERLGARGLAALERERRRGRIRAGRNGDRAVDLERPLGRYLLEQQGRGRRRGGRRAGRELSAGMRRAADRRGDDRSEQAEPDRLARIGAPQRTRAQP